MHALVVDDSRAMRRIVGGILARAGYDVSEAGDGREALEVLQALDDAGTRPVLACIDWNMPVMDGLTLVSEVRRRPAWRAITLVMVTTESEQDRIVRALAAGAHEYLTKPFAPEDLLAKLGFLGVLPAGAR